MKQKGMLFPVVVHDLRGTKDRFTVKARDAWRARLKAGPVFLRAHDLPPGTTLEISVEKPRMAPSDAKKFVEQQEVFRSCR